MKHRFLLIGIVLGVGLLSYALATVWFAPRTAPVLTAAPVAASPVAQVSPTAHAQDVPILSPMLAAAQTEPTANYDKEHWTTRALRIIWRLLLAVGLSAILAFRPRRNVPLLKRNLYVAQTQILLAVVAAALMLIVGDNAARAFAIFAAVSLVRFRTNIRDPKEITVLLISLALGLATGVGRWELAVVLCLFVLPLLWFLELNEPEQVFRPMQLTIKTRNPDMTQHALKQVFAQHALEGEMREFNLPVEDTPGCLMYYLNLRLNLSTDRINEDIVMADPESIAGLSWEQKKSPSQIYQ